MNIYWLGAPSDDSAQAIGDYLAALKDAMSASWARAAKAYTTLKQVREKLGLPFIDDSAGTPEQGTAASHGAWTSALDTQAQDLHAMSTLIVNALGDAVAGKRKVLYDAPNDQLVIEALDSDVVLLGQNAQGVPVLVGGPASVNPGQETHVSAPIGVGVPAIVWVATATVSVLALPVYFVVDSAVNSMTDIAEQKLMKTTIEKSYECVQSGKCTPAEAAAINQSVYAGAAALREAKAKEEAAKKPIDWSELLKSAAWLVGIGVVGYAAIKLLSAVPAPRASSTKLLPAHAA